MFLGKKYLLEKVSLVLWCLVVESEVQSSWQLLFGHLIWLDCFRFFCFLGFQMTYDWPKPPQDGLLKEGHKNHPPFHVGRRARPLQKLGDKGWPPCQGQSVSANSGTACYIHMSYTYAHIMKIIHIIHVCIYTYIIYPHIMPYCNIHGFSMKSIFEQLKMMRKGCTWRDSAGLHTFNWSATYWSSVMSGDKPSNSSQATGECIKRWYLTSNILWRVKHNEEYWNLINLSFLMSQTVEVSFLDLLELCRLHL